MPYLGAFAVLFVVLKRLILHVVQPRQLADTAEPVVCGALEYVWWRLARCVLMTALFTTS